MSWLSSLNPNVPFSTLLLRPTVQKTFSRQTLKWRAAKVGEKTISVVLQVILPSVSPIFFIFLPSLLGGMRDLSSLTRNATGAPCPGTSEF